MASAPLILVIISLTIFGYMAYMANLITTMCQCVEGQDKKWNKLLGRNKWQA